MFVVLRRGPFDVGNAFTFSADGIRAAGLLTGCAFAIGGAVAFAVFVALIRRGTLRFVIAGGAYDDGRTGIAVPFAIAPIGFGIGTAAAVEIGALRARRSVVSEAALLGIVSAAVVDGASIGVVAGLARNVRAKCAAPRFRVTHAIAAVVVQRRAIEPLTGANAFRAAVVERAGIAVETHSSVGLGERFAPAVCRVTHADRALTIENLTVDSVTASIGGSIGLLATGLSIGDIALTGVADFELAEVIDPDAAAAAQLESQHEQRANAVSAREPRQHADGHVCAY